MGPMERTCLCLASEHSVSPFATGVMAKPALQVLVPLALPALARVQAQYMFTEGTVLNFPLKTLQGLQQS